MLIRSSGTAAVGMGDLFSHPFDDMNRFVDGLGVERSESIPSPCVALIAVRCAAGEGWAIGNNDYAI